MLCDKCQQNEASVHVTKRTLTGAATSKHFCESCAAVLGVADYSGESLLLFPWEEGGEGSFSVTGHISSVRTDAVVLRVLRCSHYPPATELAIQARYVPEGMRRVGAEFSFSFPAEKVSAIIMDIARSD